MLLCSECGATFSSGIDEPWRCPCGGPLDFEDQPLPRSDPPAVCSLPTEKGMWAFEDLIPVHPHVTLGEGDVPLVQACEWNAMFSLEYVSPSGSFKDRGASALLSYAVSLGVDCVVDDSSGNAGAAIAMYAARAGIDAEIYVPAAVKEGKLRAIQQSGAKTIRVDGSREDVTKACIERVESGDTWYGSHAWNPAFFAGTMTFAFEVCAKRDWNAPDAVVVPLGHGTLFLGAYRGFISLLEVGWIEQIPELYGVQAAGYAPIADEYHRSSGVNNLADGIQIMNPARENQIHYAVEASGGDVIAVTEEAVKQELDRLHRAGFYVEPTSAAAPAGLCEYREKGIIGTEETVVVPLTGSGFKAA